ncbi:hypothetical protein JQU17_01035 [Ponticoccus sp. SC2-23]|uniref:hypothetical protein n=1 Tax=Alexandriicola marinus TaxID=2081710 RepID=UPI000FDB7509|nr:hypothetical protein [Alexandriicola marinus]MBM1218765.1 hypothetical protein [Ponticoccus sp. SC6-9]MBM1224163.1 hypothetical protein [Ponticoccus sp. SC6-15]MBM1230058.1 hypothetical protein [Ponticoccus sp. SC6-38]MBM1233129.1 hypothetical protein [Ponticoccus sp. SC6-45]MBM1236921.1 hypothetical protein [Ponticoccus sp. SC6-49]MBM1242140.1 hypothetical protein [Ponticoccus sp. SC2-64]MBM1246653.1 hypothetical protein [Ponticoccus sp. SC6-42]MBM1251131.1 hypothetical protein [Pontico
MADAVRIQQNTPNPAADRLRAALIRLGLDREALQDTMGCKADGPDQALRLVAEEIDEVVLPRRIEVTTKGSAAGVLVAANRRLIGITPPAGDTIEEGDAEAAALRHAASIRRIAERSGGITLNTLGRASNAGLGGASCSAEALMRAGKSFGHEARITQFLERITPRVSGWRCHLGDSGETYAHGPDEIRSRLGAIDAALAHSPGRCGSQERLERAGPSSAALAIGPGIQAVVARDGRSRLLAAIPDSALGSVLESWTKIFGD